MDDSSPARFWCSICGGPIYIGEPVVYDPETQSVSHRFSTWCQHYLDQDRKFASDCGIDLGDNPNVIPE